MDLTNSIDVCGQYTSTQSSPMIHCQLQGSPTSVEHSSNEINHQVTLQKGIRTTHNTYHVYNFTSYHPLLPSYHPSY